MSKLTDSTWWKAALLRALYTAIAIAIPYIAAVQIAEVPWLMVASAAAVGFILSIATSLFGLPESEGVDLPWWLAALERVAKTFAQAIAAGLTGATFLADVDWNVVLQAALGAALISLLRLILATLPNDPTPAPAAIESYVIHEPNSWAQRAVDERIEGGAAQVIADGAQRGYDVKGE